MAIMVKIWSQLHSRIWRKPCVLSPKSSCRLKYSDLFWEINSDQRKSILTKKEPKRACCATRELSIKKHFSDCINLWMWQRIKGGTLLNLVIFPPKCYFLLSWEITTEKSLSLTDISIKTERKRLVPSILHLHCQTTRTRSANFEGVNVHIMIPLWISYWCFKVGCVAGALLYSEEEKRVGKCVQRSQGQDIIKPCPLEAASQIGTGPGA